MRINQYDEAWVTWWDGESCTRRGGGRGRLRAEPKADDPADNPRWESRRARVQKDMTPLAAEDRGSNPCTAHLSLELEAAESLVRGRNQCAQGCGVGFRKGLSGSRAPVFNLGSPKVILLWENGE